MIPDRSGATPRPCLSLTPTSAQAVLSPLEREDRASIAWWRENSAREVRRLADCHRSMLMEAAASESSRSAAAPPVVGLRRPVSRGPLF